MNNGPGDNGDFTAAELIEAHRVAEKIRRQTQAWQRDGSRETVRGVCIDGAGSLDRDDAIWMQLDAHGRLVIDVTVIDVAAMIGKDSPLDLAARTRGTSIYHGGSVKAPMFPEELSWDDAPDHGQLVLTDKGMRPGLTTRLTIDPASGHVLQAEIIESLITADIMSHEEMARAMRRVPPDDLPLAPDTVRAINEGGDRYRLWAFFSQAISRAEQAHRQPILPFYRQENGTVTELTEEWKLVNYASATTDVHAFVRDQMLRANGTMAQQHRLSGVPFPFRTHYSMVKGDERELHRLHDLDAVRVEMKHGTNAPVELVNRARYDAVALPHLGLDLSAYAQTTSPIRRYPDVIAQRMMHWRVAANAALAEGLAAASGQVVADIRARLWQAQTVKETYLPADALPGHLLAQTLYNATSATSKAAREVAVRQLSHYLQRSLKLLGSATPEAGEALARTLADDARLTPPYTRDEMTALTAEMTERLTGRETEEERDAVALLSGEMERRLSNMERQVAALLDEPDEAARSASMAALSQSRFSTLLWLAAESDKAHRVPARLVADRFAKKRLKEPGDLAILLGEMQPQREKPDRRGWDDEAERRHVANLDRWARLKEHVIATRFQTNPAFTKGFLGDLARREGANVKVLSTTLIADEQVGRGPMAAVVRLQPEDGSPPLVPSRFSVGHWGKSTRHHARIQFLREWAAGELQPGREPTLPTALELMVYDADHDRTLSAATCHFIRSALEDQAVGVRERYYARSGRYVLSLSSDTFGSQRFVGQGPTREQARHGAYQAMLSTRVARSIQSHLFSLHERLEQIPPDAEEAVAEVMRDIHASGAGNQVRLETAVSRRGTRSGAQEDVWSANALLTIGHGLHHEFERRSTQKEVAQTMMLEDVLGYIKERAAHGERLFGDPLERYQNRVAERYVQAVADGQVRFSETVPYAAELRDTPSPDRSWRRLIVPAASTTDRRGPGR